MPITSLGKLLGHADLSTTQLYTAGADPELCAAFQQAMQRLDQARPPLPPPAATRPAAPPTPPEPLAPPLARAADGPDEARWAPDLPAAIRQACLAFVHRRRATWKPQRQAINARKTLGEFRRFFQWQASRRALGQPGELSLADLQAYQAARAADGKAATTLNRTLDYVLSLIKEQADQGQPVDASVLRLRPQPRPDRLPRHLHEDESQRVEAYFRARLDSPEALTRLENACFFVLAHTGLRASECLDLQGQDLDLPAGRLVVRQGKGQRDRVVYLSPPARRGLATYLAGATPPANAPLWLRPDGRPVSYMWLYEHILALGQAAGVAHLTPHRLRHTLATRLLNAGMDITRIQKLLGHDHLSSTLIYARVLDLTVEADYRRALAEIERRQMPLSDTPQPAEAWPTQSSVDRPAGPAKITLDNSV